MSASALAMPLLLALSVPGWESLVAFLLYAAAILLFAVGIVGCVLPYPGHIVIVGACALWAAVAGAPYPSAALWVILGLLALFGSFADNIFALLGAKRFGCSRAAFWCSLVGVIVGLFFFPLGLFLGPFLGAFLGELVFSKRSVEASARSGLGALLGTLAGMCVKFIIAGIMIILFFWAS